MAAKNMKAGFMTGIHYLNHQQYIGGNIGGMQMINRRLQFGKSLYSKDLYAHYGCVNAVEFSNDGEWLVSGGDDKRVLIWNVDRTLSGSYQPKVMKGEHNSNIFCLGFNASHSKLYSAGNDEQVILHDVKTGEILDVFLHDEAVYGLSVHPVNDYIFVSACDDGRVLIWDARQTYGDAFTLASCSSAYHAVMHNPVESQYIATANAKDGVYLWDVRKPRSSVMKYGSTHASQSAMSVRFNATGTQILALRRRLPPVLYDVASGHTAVEFDHPEYYNSCTMKSCCFAGERDQYVLSGSDDFKLYIWKIPDNLPSKKRVLVNKAHFVLRGHRSIVNQVRYNNAYGILASSGVEKIVKIWSSFPISYNDVTEGYTSENDLSRKVYSHEEYINLVLESGQFMTHDYSHHSVQEDPRMMAFFDSLVQRDIEGWTSDSSDTTDILTTSYEVQSSDSSHSSSSSQSSSDTDDEQPSNDELVAGNNILFAYQSAQFLNPSLNAPPSETSDRGASKNVNDCPEDQKDFSIDRISQLIAQKRQETKRKNATKKKRVTFDKFKYKTKCLKKKCSETVSVPENDGSELERCSNPVGRATRERCTNPGGRASLQSILEGDSKALSELKKVKDKRKLLSKKRFKLSKEAAFVDSSSSTDSDTDAGEPISNSSAENDEPKPAENDSGIVLDTSTETEAVDVNNGASHKDCGSVDSILPNPPSNGVNGNATDSNSLVYFAPKNGKHNNRNYRKRSAEEMDDE